MLQRVPSLPTRGVSDITPFIQTPGDVCPPGSMLNVRALDQGTGRQRLAPRPGTRKLFALQLAGRPQAMGVVSRAASVVGYEPDVCAAITGTSRVAGALSGNLWVLDSSSLAMTRDMFVDASPFGATSPNAIEACAWHPTDDRVVAAANFTNSGLSRGEAIVRYLNPTTGATIWTAQVFESGVNRFVDSVLCLSEHALVCSGERVLVYKLNNPSQGSLVQTVNISWARQCVQACRLPSGEVVVGFDGSPVGATLPSLETVEPDLFAVHFRSGLMRFSYNPAASSPLSQVPYGTPLSSGSTWFEAAHGYWRVSEKSASAPRGCQINGVAAGPDGSVVFVRTNQGIGPNSGFLPDGSTAYISVTKIAPNGVLQWEADTDSLRELMSWTGGTYYNDIPAFDSKDPSLLGVDVGPDGTVFVAGRRNSGGHSVFALSGTDGRVLWRTNLQASSSSAAIRQGGVRVDPSDGNPVFVGDRNNAWNGAASRQAHLWKLDKASGNVLRHADLGAGVSALALDIRSGRLVYGTDKV